ncbi:hypothetical protein QJQ45_003442 [Haematococcus lacustris]|nr:hypothetical protein QJQ45_003442 [Haematococcus lacustris]
MAKPTTGASRQSSLAVDSAGKRANRLLAAADGNLKVKRGQPQASIPAVAREHGIPYATLYRVIKRGGVIAKRGRPTALSALQEEQLRDLVRMAASCHLTGFVYAGKQLSHSALGAIHFYPQSSIILKKGTHMMDGRLFPKLFPKQIPGGAAPTVRWWC